MPLTNPQYDAEPSISDRTSDAVEQTKSKVTEFGSNAADKFDQNRGAAASGLDSASDTLHQHAQDLPGGEKVANVAHSAADKLSEGADYIRQNDLNDMLKDGEDLVKRNPGPALLIAAGVGFLLARAFSGE